MRRSRKRNPHLHNIATQMENLGAAVEVDETSGLVQGFKGRRLLQVDATEPVIFTMIFKSANSDEGDQRYSEYSAENLQNGLAWLKGAKTRPSER